MKKILTILGSAALLSACSGGGATVEGNIAQGGGRKSIFVERLLPSGRKTVDSVKTDRSGRFSLRLQIAGDVPEFYSLRIAGGGAVPLLALVNERIKLHMADSTARAYEVDGSVGSAEVLQINRVLNSSAAVLDSLATRYGQTQDTVLQQQIAREFAAAQIVRKQAAIGFLVNHPGSMASILPLYQPMPGGEFIFSEPEDVVYFKMVADSLSSKYPGSPYAKSLAMDVQSFDNIAAAGQLVSQSMDNVVAFPEIEMPDVLGKKQRLSDLKGKVILLSFTASNLAELKILNRELVEVHDRHAKEGFEVFQVSLDLNKAQWIGSVADQRLPWISVCDLKGGDSPAVSLYNVRTIPANYLIDREGNIVRRNLLPSEIEAAVVAVL